MRPLVSIIIPVYNTKAYLSETINSVVNQTYKHIEIIIVDDGSTDGSSGIIQDFASKDERIKALEQTNQGVSQARNKGIGIAQGKYLYFMDSDDLLMPEAISICVEKCEQLQLDFAFFDADIICEQGFDRPSWGDYHRSDVYDENVCYDGVSLFEDMLKRRTLKNVVWLFLYKAEYLKKISLSFYPGIIHEDELFCVLQLLQSKRIGYIKQSLVKHRIRSNSITSTKYSIFNVNCYLTVIDELFKFTKGNPTLKNSIRRYTSYTLNAVFCTAFNLPFKDKCKAYHRLVLSGYAPYVSFINTLRFWLKK